MTGGSADWTSDCDLVKILGRKVILIRTIAILSVAKEAALRYKQGARAAQVQIEYTSCLLTVKVTCRDVFIDLSIQLPDCPGGSRPHPHQEVLIITDVTLNLASSPGPGHQIEEGGGVVPVQVIAVC